MRLLIACALALLLGCHRSPTPHTFGATVALGPATPVNALDPNGNPLGTSSYPVYVTTVSGPDGGVQAPGTPAYNPTWYADTAIYLDQSGTAGGNDGSPCTAIGSPCRTWAEFVRRWGSTEVTYPNGASLNIFLESPSIASDPMNLRLHLSGGGKLILQGVTIPSGGSGTLGTVTSKATASNQELNAVLTPAGGTGVAVDQLIINTTHPSCAWIKADVSGTTWAITQPMVCQTAGGFSSTEVNTWALGDAYTLNTVTPANIGTIDVTGGYLWTWRIATALSSGNELFLGSQLVLSETQVNGVLTAQLAGALFDALNSDFANSSLGYLFTAQNIGFGAPAFFAGMIRNGVLSGTNLNFDCDFVIASGAGVAASVSLGTVAIDNTTELQQVNTVNSTSNCGGSSVLYGAGKVDVQGTGRLRAAGTAANTFKLAGGYTLNGQTTAQSVAGSAGASAIPCVENLTNTNMDTASSSTCATSGFGGVAAGFGGASLVVNATTGP